MNAIRSSLMHCGAGDWLRLAGGAIACYFFYIMLIRRPE
jgi:hypothetical protein